MASEKIVYLYRNENFKTMKRLTLLAALLAASLNLVAQNRVVAVEGLEDTPAGLSYSLPQNCLAIDLVVEHEEVLAGPYARYALKCLGLRAPFSDKSSWRLVRAEVALADDLMQAKELAEPQVVVNPQDVGAFEPLPIDRTELIQPTDEEAAMLAAKRIFQLRRSRLELITGEAGEHVFGEGLKSALEEIDRQEQALIDLFLGRRIVRTSTHRILLTPNSEKRQYILSRFSQQSGLLPVSDLAGEIILLEITPSEPYAVEEAPEKSTQFVTCRVAAPSLCSVQSGGRELGSTTLPLFAYGKRVQLQLPKKR